MFFYPRFSYGCPKVRVRGGVPVPSRVVRAVSGGYAGTGLVRAGWVYRVGNTGYLPSQPALLGERYPRQRSGPRNPPCRGGWSGWSGIARANGGTGTVLVPPSGPGQPARGPPCTRTLQGPTWARFDLLFLKLSQNQEVSPKSVNKACHSPYIQKRVRKVTS